MNTSTPTMVRDKDQDVGFEQTASSKSTRRGLTLLPEHGAARIETWVRSKHDLKERYFNPMDQVRLTILSKWLEWVNQRHGTRYNDTEYSVLLCYLVFCNNALGILAYHSGNVNEMLLWYRMYSTNKDPINGWRNELSDITAVGIASIEEACHCSKSRFLTW